jgi:hypothetical protein
MKREWKISEDFIFMIGVIHFVVFAVIFAIVASTTEGPNETVGLYSWIALGLWIGPYIIAGILATLFKGIPALWACRPRRVWRPITEDARENHRKLL